MEKVSLNCWGVFAVALPYCVYMWVGRKLFLKLLLYLFCVCLCVYAYTCQ